jgi:O-antigen ligase
MKKPIAGYGVDVDFEITKSFLQYGDTPEKAYWHTHSDYTQIAVQFGLVALGLFILLLATAFFYSIKLPPPIKYFAALMIIEMCIDMSFNVPMYFCRHKFVVMFTMAIVFAEILYNRRNV